ncbi:unnamed protein product [Moneuplotes crassus]|uniref:Uncharacterized protein n=1 Tax=Euplotes crassus TaxID=5936 RepID=A0AAD1ULY0_EUPCR|nr:unnamed protein product [Moneuplotes crassus]
MPPVNTLEGWTKALPINICLLNLDKCYCRSSENSLGSNQEHSLFLQNCLFNYLNLKYWRICIWVKNPMKLLKGFNYSNILPLKYHIEISGFYCK